MSCIAIPTESSICPQTVCILVLTVFLPTLSNGKKVLDSQHGQFTLDTRGVCLQKRISLNI